LDFKYSKELFELKELVYELFPEFVRQDEKKYIPHLTIKRWQRYERGLLETGVKVNKFVPVKFYISNIVLFKSEKKFPNNKYHVIQKVDFRLHLDDL
jgi:2'-5' RNA ligase